MLVRHRFADTTDGLEVVMPNGEKCTFAVELDEETQLIRRLVRRPSPSSAGSDAGAVRH
jgi:hypothetical protein